MFESVRLWCGKGAMVREMSKSDIEAFMGWNEEKLHREIHGQINCSMWQCVQATQPGTWIVSDLGSERRAEKFKDSKIIPRSHQRRRWIVITDQERRRSFRESVANEGGEDRSVTPHARRAHYRHVGENEDGSKRYTWVRACWVGSTEAEIRGQRYRVELEL